MPSVAVARIERSRLESLVDRKGHSDTPLVYTDRNPLVRELFWRRLGALLSLSESGPRERVLDFGGGNGVLTPTLSRLYQQVDVVDLRTEMVEELREKDGLRNVHPRAGDIFTLALPEAGFDTIVAADVLEHIIDLPPLIREFRRLLKPEGELLVSAPSENAFYELGRKMFRYTKPDDHFHPATYIAETISRELRPARCRYFPIPVAPMGVFLLQRFVKDDDE
jgi:2-polyprenyl-3-methyl-5-hydroxy-6-metoxy-1,4-benzoquinol methylase